MQHPGAVDDKITVSVASPLSDNYLFSTKTLSQVRLKLLYGVYLRSERVLPDQGPQAYPEV